MANLQNSMRGRRSFNAGGPNASVPQVNSFQGSGESVSGQNPIQPYNTAPNYSAPGQQPPQLPGQVSSQFYGQPPPLPGQQTPQLPGQQPPQLPGQVSSQFYGQPPSLPGQQPPQLPGQQPPQLPGQQPPQLPGQQPPQLPGQVSSQFYGKPPPLPGQQPPELPNSNPGQFVGPNSNSHSFPNPNSFQNANQGQFRMPNPNQGQNYTYNPSQEHFLSPNINQGQYTSPNTYQGHSTFPNTYQGHFPIPNSSPPQFPPQNLLPNANQGNLSGLSQVPSANLPMNQVPNPNVGQYPHSSQFPNASAGQYYIPNGSGNFQSQPVGQVVAPTIPSPPSLPPSTSMPLPPSIPGASLNDMGTVYIPCKDTIAQELLGGDIQGRLMRQFSLSKVSYSNGTFILICNDPGMLQEAKSFIESTIESQDRDQGQSVKWAWMNDQGKFIEYDSITCGIIENSYQRGQKFTMINISGQSYRVEFGNPHKQVFPQSDIARTVRRLTDEEAKKINEQREGDVIWYWNRKGKFLPYTPEASRIIEEAYVQGIKSVLIPGKNNKGYMVDFHNMVQYNELSNYKREIKRGPL